MATTQQKDTATDGAAASKILRNAATRSTIDGVTTLFSAVGGRSRATLSFRVGTVDEPLHLRGINHLVGHLASAAADQDGGDCHVTVSASTLSFQFSGNALAVANEIGAVCHWIGAASSAPVDARTLQRARLAAEADQRLHAPEHLRVLRARFGPAGWGAGSYPELGLGALDVEDVRAWVATYLTTGNAVLALSGTKATTLRVPLPKGEYVAVPELPPSALRTPALVASDTPVLSLSGLITTDANHLDRDRAVAGLTTEILRARVAYALRRRYGREIVARGGPMALGSTAVHAVVWADVDAEREAKVADIAAESLAVLAGRKLVDGELEAQVKRRLGAYEKAAASPAGQHELLHRQALGALNNAPWSLALERRRLSTADPQQIAQQLEDLAATSVLMMTETDPPVRAWHTPPAPPSFTAAGDVFRSRPAYGLSARRRPSRLIVGREGVTIRGIDRPDEQLRWDEVAMAQVWDDGRHLLTSTRSHTLDIVPEQWLAPEAATGAVRRRLDAAPVVRMGERDTPPAAPTRITDRVAPAWWWAGALTGLVMLALTLLPLWSEGTSWLRWVVGALGVVALVVGGAWAYDTAITERRLRGSRPAGSAPPAEPATPSGPATPPGADPASTTSATEGAADADGDPSDGPHEAAATASQPGSRPGDEEQQAPPAR